MRRLLIILFLLFSFTGYSQSYINKTKAQVKKGLNSYIAKNAGLNATVVDTDSVLTLEVKATPSLPASFIYRFDKEGKCKSEKVVTGCDSCYNKYLTAALNQKIYRWKKINGNQYISTYAAKRMIELPGDKTDFSYVILRTDWSKQMYQLLKNSQ